MANKKNSPEKFFKRLTRIFKTGVQVKRKIKGQGTTVASNQGDKSSSTLLFQKSFSPTYATITNNAYNIAERMVRYADYQAMESTAEISAALDLWADESCSPDENGRTLHIFSDNEKIQRALEDLFYNTLNVEFNLRAWIRNLCKHGDLTLLNDVHPKRGVINCYPIPINEIEREEGYDPENPSAVRFRWVSLGNRILENWEVSHFRLLGQDQFLPYGCSVIEAARRVWRQLILIEDAMLVYRVVRAPERRVFYVDVGNLPANDIPPYMELQKQNLRMNQVVDSTTNRVDMRYNPLSVDEDYFLPVRGGDTGTKIDTLQAGQNTGTVEDVAYIQKKLFSALKVPKAYLGYEEGLSSKSTLSQIDIRFSRSVSVIQKTMIAEMNKLAIIHLYTLGFDNDDLVNFTLRLSNPSTVAEQQKLELWRTRFEIGGSLPEGMGTKQFVYKTIWGLTDEQIDEINNDRVKETLVDATIAAMAEGEAPSGPGGGGGGGGAPPADGLDIGDGGEDEDIFADDEGGGGMDDLGGDESEPADDDVPDEENASEEPLEDEPDLELLTASDDAGDGKTFKIPSMSDSPVNVAKQLKRALYNNSRHRTHGPSKTHMPDFLGMVNSKRREDTMNDPFDTNDMKALVTNPFGESTNIEHRTRTLLSSNVLEMLHAMENSERFQDNKSSQQNLLSEGTDVQDDLDDIDVVFDDSTSVDDEFVDFIQED